MLLSYKYYERTNAPPPVLVVIKHLTKEGSEEVQKVQFLTVNKENEQHDPGSGVIMDLDFSAELDNISRSELETKLKLLQRSTSSTLHNHVTVPRIAKLSCPACLKPFYTQHRALLKTLWVTFSYTFLNFLYFAFGYFFFTYFQKHRHGITLSQWTAEIEHIFGDYAARLPLNHTGKMAKIIRIGELQCQLNKRTLTFWTSFDFCVSVITTVGWGYIYPKTALGKLFCLVYAAFGVPLYIVVIGANGHYIGHLAGRLDWCLKYKFVYLELVSKYIIVGILVGVFIFSHTQTAYTSSRHTSHKDEHLREWSWFECLYYSFVSLTTIGFGDYFMPSSSDQRQMYSFLQAMALLVSIIFGFALFTYAFNAYAEASRRKMQILRSKYEALATRNAAIAMAGFYANSELMFEKSQQFISNNENLKRMSTAIDGFKDNTMVSAQKIVLESIALKRMIGSWKSEDNDQPYSVCELDPFLLQDCEVQSIKSMASELHVPEITLSGSPTHADLHTEDPTCSAASPTTSTPSSASTNFSVTVRSNPGNHGNHGNRARDLQRAATSYSLGSTREFVISDPVSEENVLSLEFEDGERPPNIETFQTPGKRPIIVIDELIEVYRRKKT